MDDLSTKIATLEEVRGMLERELKAEDLNIAMNDKCFPVSDPINSLYSRIGDQIRTLKIQAEKKAKEDGFKALLEKVG